MLTNASGQVVRPSPGSARTQVNVPTARIDRPQLRPFATALAHLSQTGVSSQVTRPETDEP